MKMSRRTMLAAVALALLVAPGCTRVERVDVEGVDCVVAKAPAGNVRALDCNWPNEDDTNSPQ